MAAPATGAMTGGVGFRKWAGVAGGGTSQDLRTTPKASVTVAGVARSRETWSMDHATSPGPLRRIANLWALVDLPGALGRLQAGGRSARMDIGPYPVAYTGRPATVRALLDGRLEGMAERGRFYEDISRVIGRSSLVTCEGEKHRRLRRAVAPAFRREQVAAYGDLMVERASAMAAKWADGDRVALDKEMAALTLDIAARSLFGVDIAGELSEFSTILETGARIFYRLVLPRGLSDALWRNPYSPANQRLAAAQKRVDSFVSQLIAERRAQPHQPDGGPAPNLLDFLLAARDEDGAPLSDEEVRDQVVTFLFAGHETTAQALTWAFVLLSTHPEAERRLAEESRSLLGRSERDGRAESLAGKDLADLPWARAVTSETLRLYPPAWFLSREAATDTEVDGCPVAAGTLFLTSPLAVQRDPMYWERPLEFDPSRWLTQEVGAGPTEAYFPFGHGRRNCIGSSFALTEVPLVLATVLGQWMIDVAGAGTLKMRPTVTLRPRGHVYARVTRRDPPGP
ncbi:MAG: cytochrome P450 [Acidimicrobiales bacterium]